MPAVIAKAVDTLPTVVIQPTTSLSAGTRDEPLVEKPQDLLSSDLELPHTFGQMLIAAFRRAGETRAIRYDEDSFCLVLDGDDGAFRIGTLFKEFLRTKTEHWKLFFTNAWTVWRYVQRDPLPLPHWIPALIRPFRDETHPLSYHLVEAPGTHLWTVTPPFEDYVGSEWFDLVGAYEVWWSSQLQRACMPHLRNVNAWLESSQVTVAGLSILVDMRRLWRRGQLAATTDTFARLLEELKWLGAGSAIPQALEAFLDAALREVWIV